MNDGRQTQRTAWGLRCLHCVQSIHSGKSVLVHDRNNEVLSSLPTYQLATTAWPDLLPGTGLYIRIEWALLVWPDHCGRHILSHLVGQPSTAQVRIAYLLRAYLNVQGQPRPATDLFPLFKVIVEQNSVDTVWATLQFANICLELGKEIMAGSCFGHHHRNLLIHTLLFTTNPGGIPVLLDLPNSPSPDNTPMMDGLGYASTWPKHILQSQIFLSVQNKLACQKLQTHNSNLLTLVKDTDREQSVSLDSQVSCVAFSTVFNYPSIPLWTPR